MKTLYALIVAALLSFTAPALAQTDTIILTNPVQPAPVATSYVLGFMEIDWLTGYVAFVLTADNGEVERIPLTGPEGQAAIDALNSSDVAIKNLRRFGLRWLAKDHLDGTVAD